MITACAVNVLMLLDVNVPGLVRVATRLPGSPASFSLILTLVLLPDVSS